MTKVNRMVVELLNEQYCPVEAIALYERYRGKITDIETVEQRNNILSDMQQYFEREVRQRPQNRDKLSEIYQLLKQKCWEI